MPKKLTSVTLILISVLAINFGALPLASASAIPASKTAVGTASTIGGTPDILVTPVQGPSVTQRLTTRTEQSWPWYITRAAGIVAAISLIALMLSGIGLITGLTFKFLEPLTAWATHRAIAMAFGVSVVIHIVALLFDKFVPFTIAQALIPYASQYRTVTIAGHHLGSLYVALGIFAVYGILAIILTSLLWIDKRPRIWKLFHFLSYLVMIFVFFHALYLGTDLAHGIFRILWIIFGVAVAIAIIYRLRRAGST